MSDSYPPDSLHEMHEEISSVYHDMNNPLSIISGNAQFLLELSREKNVGEEFISSVRDIKEATERMSDSLSRLTRLKEELEDLA